MKSYPLMLITWEDHSGDAGWSTEEEEKKKQIVTAKTIGWLVHKDRKKIHIADTLLEDGFGGVTLILKSAILEQEELEL